MSEDLIAEVRALRVEAAALVVSTERVCRKLDSATEPGVEGNAAIAITEHPCGKSAAVVVAEALRNLLQHYGHARLRPWYSDIAATGDTTQTGIVAACLDIAAALAQCPDGRKALCDFGFEPIPEHVEGE